MNYNNQNQMRFGTSYAGVKQAQMVQPLSKEQISKLRQNNERFTINLSQKDIDKGICTHKDNGQISLLENQDGTVTCSICGETFALVNKSVEEVAQITQDMLDILQSIKTYYLDMPLKTATEFFRIIPLIKKIPQIYEFALNNFNSHENPQQFNNNSPYGFNMYNMLTNQGGYNPGMDPMMQNPYMQQQMNPYQNMQQPQRSPYQNIQQPQRSPYQNMQQPQENPFYDNVQNNNQQQNQQNQKQIEQNKKFVL